MFWRVKSFLGGRIQKQELKHCSTLKRTEPRSTLDRERASLYHHRTSRLWCSHRLSVKCTLEGGYHSAISTVSSPGVEHALPCVLDSSRSKSFFLTVTRAGSIWWTGSCTNMSNSWRLQSRTTTVITHCHPRCGRRLSPGVETHYCSVIKYLQRKPCSVGNTASALQC